MVLSCLVANVTFDLIMSHMGNYLEASPLYEVNSFMTINKQCYCSQHPLVLHAAIESHRSQW